MIEFAPNPSGPAHIGTLRTYAVAWLTARRLGMHLFVRFDAHDWGDEAVCSRDWADQFLDELRQLDMSPDGSQYVTEPMRTGLPPVWAELRPCPSSCDGEIRAYCPQPPPIRRVPCNSPHLWRHGQPVPYEMFAGEPGFVAWQATGEAGWRYPVEITNAVHMHLRGTRAIVRGLNVSFIRPYQEHPASRWFRLRLPKEILTSMVVSPDGAFRKREMKPADMGTVGWAIEQLGPQVLRERIVASAGDESAPPIISVYDLLDVRHG